MYFSKYSVLRDPRQIQVISGDLTLPGEEISGFRLTVVTLRFQDRYLWETFNIICLSFNICSKLNCFVICFISDPCHS